MFTIRNFFRKHISFCSNLELLYMKSHNPWRKEKMWCFSFLVKGCGNVATQDKRVHYTCKSSGKWNIHNMYISVQKFLCDFLFSFLFLKGCNVKYGSFRMERWLESQVGNVHVRCHGKSETQFTKNWMAIFSVSWWCWPACNGWRINDAGTKGSKQR